METKEVAENINHKKIKKLIQIGDYSCFTFLVSFFIYVISIPRGCPNEINTICGVIKTDNFFGYITIFIFIIFLLTVFLLIFVRIKFRNERDLIKEFSIIARVTIMTVVFILGFLVISTIALTSGNRCKAKEAYTKAKMTQLLIAQVQYFDNNNRYANTFYELINSNLISKDTAKEFENLGVEMKSSNSKSWYADVKFYSTENRFPCSDKVVERIFFCDQSGSCRDK